MSDPAPRPSPRQVTSVSRALTYDVGLAEALRVTVDAAAELLQASRSLVLLRGDDDAMHVRASHGLSDEAVERFCEPLDERLANRLTAAFGPDVDQRFLGVPLVVKGAIIGLLAVVRDQPGDFGEHEETLLTALADQLSPALEDELQERRRGALEDRVLTLERLVGNREDALRMLDHDLRSPMSALHGYVEMLLEEIYGPLTDAQRRAVSRIASIGRHIRGLLANVQAMTELGTGAIRVEPADVTVGAVVREALDVVRLAADAANVDVNLELDDQLVVRADGDRLRQVMIHLLENAVKYSPSGSRVTVRARADEDTVEIRVSDDGPGIPPEDADRIFEPYQRLPGTAGAVQGAGLGLYLGRTLVELMGGTLTLEPGDGATFVIRLKRT